jgi:hypothetical protein
MWAAAGTATGHGCGPGGGLIGRAVYGTVTGSVGGSAWGCVGGTVRWARRPGASLARVMTRTMPPAIPSPMSRAAGTAVLAIPVGEVLGLPDPGQRPRPVLVESAGVVVPHCALEHLGEHAYVGQREVEALGASRRHGVRRIAGQQQPAVPHRLGDEAAEAQDHRVGDRPFLQRERGACDRTQYGEGWLKMTARLTIFPSRMAK